ncbi:Uncharacterized protein TPAR_02358 [Tolypocladium paradoxum]|uniref:Uncharacterized protein n=1 Tax=Tolypocladium paradoxum TaxID=94208 RepID=A0A2S4L4T1_9HYPO|nr:Uncharacterized protein TPAR_02358 [Tolypocladium paradoxum]
MEPIMKHGMCGARALKSLRCHPPDIHASTRVGNLRCRRAASLQLISLRDTNHWIPETEAVRGAGDGDPFGEPGKTNEQRRRRCGREPETASMRQLRPTQDQMPVAGDCGRTPREHLRKMWADEACLRDSGGSKPTEGQVNLRRVAQLEQNIDDIVSLLAAHRHIQAHGPSPLTPESLQAPHASRQPMSETFETSLWLRISDWFEDGDRWAKVAGEDVAYKMARKALIVNIPGNCDGSGNGQPLAADKWPDVLMDFDFWPELVPMQDPSLLTPPIVGWPI